MRPPPRKARSPSSAVYGAQPFAAFSLALRVYYQDTDSGGVVFHGSYLHFFERARTEWLRQLGFDVRALAAEDGVMFIVRELRVSYVRPALVDDLLTVTAAVEHLGRAQFTLEQRVLRGEEALVEGSVNLACVSAGELKPARVPARVYAALENSGGRRVGLEEKE
jgi:acyl-CoA thioester hydrolase